MISAQWKFWRLGKRYQDLHDKYRVQVAKVEQLGLIRDKLLARSERFRTSCISLEKQKGALQLRAEAAEALAEERWAEIWRQREEIIRMTEDDETFGVGATR